MQTRHDAAADSAHALDAWAQRAGAANGFADADIALAPLPLRAEDAEFDRIARSHPAYRLSELIVELGASLADTVRRAWQRWQRRRDVYAGRRALHELDARTLHDIGVTRTDTWTAAADASRTRAPLPLRGPAL